MVAKVFDDILLKGIRSGQAPARTGEARKWYRDQAADVAKSAAKGDRLVRETSSDRLKAKSRFRIGSMYMFAYDPKHKETLPYYDRFPLVIPIGPAKGGFIGINFHYLPPRLRAKLFDALYDTATNERFDESTRLRVNYGILSNAAKFKEFKPCIKHYLTPHIRTRLIYVNPSEWDIALFLPSANFYGANRSKVYAESRQKIRGS
jgi:hypothetical protein